LGHLFQNHLFLKKMVQQWKGKFTNCYICKFSNAWKFLFRSTCTSTEAPQLSHDACRWSSFSALTTGTFIQLEYQYLGFLAVSSAKPDNIFWSKFEETLFRWLIWITFLQIFSHLHLWGNVCRWCLLVIVMMYVLIVLPFSFLPPLAESQINPNEVSFSAEPSRQTLFQGKMFIFLTSKQVNKIVPCESHSSDSQHCERNLAWWRGAHYLSASWSCYHFNYLLK
jgi:hypothetical protein